MSVVHERPASVSCAGRESPAAPVAPEIAVTLEVLFDVNEIAAFDSNEMVEFGVMLAHVDRATSVGTWYLGEPTPMRDWRLGVALRAPRNDVAAAILHALEPYHALIRDANPTVPVLIRRLPIDRVAVIRRTAIMKAWIEQMEQTAAGDAAENIAWIRYWTTINSPEGTRQDTIAWQRGIERRARLGSAVAGRLVEAIRRRHDALGNLARVSAHVGTVIVQVPGIGPWTEGPPSGSPAGPPRVS